MSIGRLDPGAVVRTVTALAILSAPVEGQDPPVQQAMDTAQTAVETGSPSTPARAFRSLWGAQMLFPIGEQVGFGPVLTSPTGGERLPSGRASITIQANSVWGWHFGAMRLAPNRLVDVAGYSTPLQEQLALTAGFLGFRLNILRGRVRLAPFADVGGGLMQAAVDSGGYSYAGGYQANWRRLEGPMFGGGGGLMLDFILGPGLTLSSMGGYWHFRSPNALVAPLEGAFAGAGLSLAFKSDRWYWRTSGRDRDGPMIHVMDPEPRPDGVIDIGQPDGTVRFVVADLSGVESVTLAGREARIDDAPSDVVGRYALVGQARLVSADVSLAPGPNTVRLVATDGAGNELTRDYQILGIPLDEEPPSITVLTPQDGTQLPEARVLVTGVVSDNGDVTALLINNIPVRTLAQASPDERAAAQITDARPAYRFSSSVAIPPGTSQLQIAAADTAGNQELVQVSVSSPEPEPEPTVAAVDQGPRPTIDILQPTEWIADATRGISIVPRRSMEVRGVVRYTGGIAEITVDGQRASVQMDNLATRANFLGFVSAIDRPRQVVITARGTDGVTTTRTFSVIPEPQTAPPPAEETFQSFGTRGQRWAIVIGISEYQDERVPDLQYADDDAQAFYDFLRSPRAGLGGIPEENIRFLLNEQATERNIRTALLTFLRSSTPDDVIMVYLAGHGMPDPLRQDDLYLLAYDTDMDNLPVTGIPMALVQRAVTDAFSYNAIVLTDACHSGAVGVDNTRAGNTINQVNEVFLDRMVGSSGGLVTFTASETNQLSQEGEQWGGGHGVFTHFLLEGLNGEADENGDQLVDLGELMEYTRDRVRRETQNSQVPTISQTSYDRHWPMANLGAGS